MSGVVKKVGSVFVGVGKGLRGEKLSTFVRETSADTPPQPAGRVASPEEKVLALRRRRGSRALLSQERVDAEAGLGGQQTTLGGM
jgi:hypothetical protein